MAPVERSSKSIELEAQANQILRAAGNLDGIIDPGKADQFAWKARGYKQSTLDLIVDSRAAAKGPTEDEAEREAERELRERLGEIERHRMRVLMTYLTPLQREYYKLYFVEGLRQTEIARRKGTTQGSVWKSLFGNHAAGGVIYGGLVPKLKKLTARGALHKAHPNPGYRGKSLWVLMRRTGEVMRFHSINQAATTLKCGRKDIRAHLRWTANPANPERAKNSRFCCWTTEPTAEQIAANLYRFWWARRVGSVEIQSYDTLALLAQAIGYSDTAICAVGNQAGSQGGRVGPWLVWHQHERPGPY